MLNKIKRVLKIASEKVEFDEFVKCDRSKIAYEIRKFKNSSEYKQMIIGERYFEGKHDILFKTRSTIGKSGQLVDLSNLPNNKIIDNQYKKVVSQKVNFLVGKSILFQTDNEKYSNELIKIMNKSMVKTINALGIDSLNCGIGWLYVYYDEKGILSFKRFRPTEIIPVWKDSEHSELDYVIRLFNESYFKSGVEVNTEMVEVYTKFGIEKYEYRNGSLVSCEPSVTPYFAVKSGSNIYEFNWEQVPIIPFKYNSREIPLITMVKSLQDGINIILSNFQDNMQEDPRNTIMVLVNYGGENLGEFRENLATYGAVKINTEDGVAGDVKTIQVEINAENYKSILALFKEALVENAMSYNAKDDRLSSNPNQMNIKSMYSDIELDANSMELEYQDSVEKLLWFVNTHLHNTKVGDFEDERVDVIFNRDMMMNESSVIEDIQKSVGILSKKTLVEQHPYVKDITRELERLQLEDVLNKASNENKS